MPAILTHPSCTAAWIESNRVTALNQKMTVSQIHFKEFLFDQWFKVKTDGPHVLDENSVQLLVRGEVFLEN
jgi:hypothetical protein